MSEFAPYRQAINDAYLCDETARVRQLLQSARLGTADVSAISQQAQQLILTTREKARDSGGIDALLREYDLSSQEGVLLMCLAEALLRIPDSAVADQLIRDKLGVADWETHLGHSHSLFVNASTWSLMLTGKLIRYSQDSMGHALGRLLERSSEPLIRKAMNESMRIVGQQFVLGETIDAALKRSGQGNNHHYRYSFDMLGEAALTQSDAAHYLGRYVNAIRALAEAAVHARDVFEAPSISVKLTALHPRFEFAQRDRVLRELVPNLLMLAQQAREAGISLTVDAEEAHRLDLGLDVFEAVYTHASLGDWAGMGLAVQAYQKRALPVLHWLQALARKQHKRIMVRLVKGAYWDTEIKLAQEQGLEGYPVFTRKPSTDVSYLACARFMLEAGEDFYPQFASHNAYTIASIQHLVQAGQAFEFQRLHGMGEAVYEAVMAKDASIPCRVYAPVGNHKDLLPYLVRRLLENGANTSFVNRIENDSLPVEELVQDPVAQVESFASIPHTAIPLPRHLFGEERLNSFGFNFNDADALQSLDEQLSACAEQSWSAAPLIEGKAAPGETRPVMSPIRPEQVVGQVTEATAEQAMLALESVSTGYQDWTGTPVESRAQIAERAADLLEQHRVELVYLCMQEGGRCLRDSVSEVREAIDACRYYAGQARQLFREQSLPGPTGESNTLRLHGRGVVLCISPWNFPVAIFTSQVIAALVAGNAVLAKPSSLTNLAAMRVVQLLHQAGVPVNVLGLLPARGSVISNSLLQDERIAGVIFTGSSDTARRIQRSLAQQAGPIAALVAETGGQNCMIVDSSALPEQVVNDVLVSAFNSAGQRCSALRVLFLQEEIAPRVMQLLQGAMAELRVGDPALLATDVGPMLDADNRDKVLAHIRALEKDQTLVCQAPVAAELLSGRYVAPTVFEIESLDLLTEEVFGPVLHIIRYHSDKLDQVIDAINRTGYGLTMGIHTRINSKAEYIAGRIRAGNIYINRNMIGAVIGVQPFGGEGLSGTGPKAGGPHYLQRLVTERLVSVNTAAIGGNASLLNLKEES